LVRHTLNEYKIVTLSYTEQASLVIKAKTNDEAEEIVWDEFGETVPDLSIISIEPCPDDVAAELKEQSAQQEFDLQPKVLN
jgi:hypothetical protein